MKGRKRREEEAKEGKKTMMKYARQENNAAKRQTTRRAGSKWLRPLPPRPRCATARPRSSTIKALESRKSKATFGVLKYIFYLLFLFIFFVQLRASGSFRCLDKRQKASNADASAACLVPWGCNASCGLVEAPSFLLFWMSWQGRRTHPDLDMAARMRLFSLMLLC